MRILGIDPGTLKLGYGVLEEAFQSIRAEDYGVLTFSSSLPIEHRLYQVHSHLLNLINMFQPDEIAVEEPFLGKGENQYVGPAFAVGQAQAAVLIAAAGQAIPVFRYTPAQVKRSVADHGTASKAQVQAMITMALGIKETISSSDAADALAIALCHLRQRQVAAVLERRADPGR